MKKYSIHVNKSEALRYLGCHGVSADKKVARQLDDAVALLTRVAEPAYTYKIFELDRRSGIDPIRIGRVNPTDPAGAGKAAEHNTAAGSTESSIALKGTSIILTGNSAQDFLDGCQSCIMMAVTIGRTVDAAIHRNQVSDMAEAVIIDSCASSAVEDICNQLGDDLEKEFLKRGLYLTDRFSPGYGDLPMELQPQICRALSAEKRIGLSVTGGTLMMPTKSVTAFIGISDRPQPKKLTGCANCAMNKSCNYRKAGVTCAG